jgi:hypothetical protein
LAVDRFALVNCGGLAVGIWGAQAFFWVELNPAKIVSLGGLGERLVVKLDELVDIEGFDGIGFALEVYEFDLKDVGFIDFDDRPDLALVEIEGGKVLIEGNDI